MRISDWSSDVCSSDLGGAKEIPFGAEREGREIVRQRHAMRPRGAARRLGERLRQVADAHAEPAVVGPLHGIAPGLAPERPIARLIALIDAPRSEERRVGNERVSTGTDRGCTYHEKKK